MQTFKPGSKKKIKLSRGQRSQIRSRKTTKRKVFAEIGLRREGAYCAAKLRAQGLIDPKQRRSKLTVLKISDMTPEQRAEFGVSPK